MELHVAKALAWAAAALLLVLFIQYLRWSSWRVTPAGIPWVPDSIQRGGLWGRWWNPVRAHLADLTLGGQFVQDGYCKYGKANLPFVVPSFLTWQPEVVLPSSQLQWLVDQPDSVLSIDRALIKDLEFSYTSPMAWSFTRPFHVEAINKLKLESLVQDMAEEVEAGINEEWGQDTQNWTEVNIEQTMAAVLLRVTSRVFVGEPLCHDQQYLQPASDFLASLGQKPIFISLTPELLRPLLARYLTKQIRKWNQQCASLTMPLIEKELRRHLSDERDTSTPAKTLLECISRVASRSGHPKDTDPFSLASRLLALNFVAVHTSNHTLVNCLVDMASPSTSSTSDIFAHIRTEAAHIHKRYGGKWSKTALSQLVTIDSALRESLRLNTFKARGLERIVVKKGGVTLPSGEHLAEGTKVGIAVLPTHRDPDIYDDALTYDALRFCRSPNDITTSSSGRRSFNTDMINSSETFLAFGHGKHVCPGRFLAAYELKLIVAYIAMNYDIEPLSERPANAHFSDFTTGRMHNLRIRRRTKSS